MTNNQNLILEIIARSGALSRAYFEGDSFDNLSDITSSLAGCLSRTKEFTMNDPILKGVWDMANDISDLIDDVT